MSYPFFKKSLKKSCYWCFEDDKSKLTMDHLPPRSIFPRQEREGLQLATAPICNECKKRHRRSGMDDENFILHMRLWKEMSLGSVNIQGKLEKFLEYSSLTKDQKIVLADYHQFTLPSGKTVKHLILKGGREVIVGVLDSVARGFYYRMSGEIIPQDVAPNLEFRPKDSFTPSINPLTIMPLYVVKKDVFEFAPVLFQDETFRYFCWQFRFFNLDPLPIYYSYYL